MDIFEQKINWLDEKNLSLFKYDIIFNLINFSNIFETVKINSSVIFTYFSVFY